MLQIFMLMRFDQILVADATKLWSMIAIDRLEFVSYWRLVNKMLVNTVVIIEWGRVGTLLLLLTWSHFMKGSHRVIS